jgi:hypothetical protein
MDVVMNSLVEIPTYQALIKHLTEDFVIESKISKRATPEINKIDPFECVDFLECDTVVMLNHLYANGLIDRDIREKPLGYDETIFYDFYYKSVAKLQPDLFS